MDLSFTTAQRGTTSAAVSMCFSFNVPFLSGFSFYLPGPLMLMHTLGNQMEKSKIAKDRVL